METVIHRYPEVRISPEYTYVCAVSGGVDSMVLLHLCSVLHIQVIVVHVQHHIREDANADAALVQRVASTYGFIYVEMHVDVPRQSKEKKENLENYARKLRYSIFETIRQQYNAHGILTAHHADDLVESVLMHKNRGALVLGTVGIRSQDEDRKVYRPMLLWRKADILAYAEEHQLEWSEDSTNMDMSLERNSIRHKEIPLLLSQNSRLYEDILHESERAQAQIAAWDDLIHPFLKLTTWKRHEVLQLDDLVLGHLYISVQRTYFPFSSYTCAHVQEKILQLRTMESGKKIEIGQGLYLVRNYDEFVFSEQKDLSCSSQEVGILLQGNEQHIDLPQGVLYIGTKHGMKFSPTLLQGAVLRQAHGRDTLLAYKGDTVYHKQVKKIWAEMKVPQSVRGACMLLVSPLGEGLALVGPVMKTYLPLASLPQCTLSYEEKNTG